MKQSMKEKMMIEIELDPATDEPQEECHGNTRQQNTYLSTIQLDLARHGTYPKKPTPWLKEKHDEINPSRGSTKEGVATMTTEDENLLLEPQSLLSIATAIDNADVSKKMG
jgi:hypothetical protein